MIHLQQPTITRIPQTYEIHLCLSLIIHYVSKHTMKLSYEKGASQAKMKCPGLLYYLYPICKQPPCSRSVLFRAQLPGHQGLPLAALAVTTSTLQHRHLRLRNDGARHDIVKLSQSKTIWIWIWTVYRYDIVFGIWRYLVWIWHLPSGYLLHSRGIDGP